MSSADKGSKDIPVSVFTGFLGAGKTTIILSLLKQLPKDYKVVLLKNEFGDVEVDSELAKESAVEAVSEILNGCMCCVLVGQMRTALLEIKEKFSPDRIIIESSGSAFPATLAWQVRQLEDEGLKLDSVVTVIDCVNFTGYEDNSPTAKMQAKYTDLLLLNKHELATERQLDTVLDHLYELNTETPKLRISREAPPKPSLIFGVLSDTSATSRVFDMLDEENEDRKRLGLFQQGETTNGNHADTETGEVQAVNLWKGGLQPGHHEGHPHQHEHEHHQPTTEALALPLVSQSISRPTRDRLDEVLAKLSSEDVWRVKGFVRLASDQQHNSKSLGYHILNWAFGRYDLHEASERMAQQLDNQQVEIRLTVMGARGEVKRRSKVLADLLDASVL